MSDLLWPLVAVAVGAAVLSRTSTPAPERDAYQRARHLAIRAIRSAPKGSVVVFDFDDTLFDPHRVVDYEHTGPRSYATGPRRALPIYSPIKEIIDVLQVASAMGHHIVVITARNDNAYTRAVVNANFRKRGMAFHLFYAAQPDSPPDFKSRLRAQLAKRYNVALTIGDQWHDVNAAGGAHWVKLPDRRDRGLYTSL